MKRFFLYIIILYSALAMVGCSDKGVVDPDDDKPKPRQEMERTVIVYIAGQNSLSDAISGDLSEMEKAKADIPANVNFIVYVDDYHNPAIYEISAKDGKKLWKQYDTQRCSTDSLTMLETLREIERFFPARHYGITFWSHASGWTPQEPRTRSFGQDPAITDPQSPKRTQEMDIPVLAGVLANLPRFDYIFFDACFMQCIEVAYELRHATKWMIGSPAEIPGPGAPYDKIVSPLCHANVEGIVNGYSSVYPLEVKNSYGQTTAYYSGVLLSCIDCEEMNNMADVTRRLLVPHYMGRVSLPFSGLQAYADDKHNPQLKSFPHFFDMRTTMFNQLTDSEYAEWMGAFLKAVPLRTYSSTRTWLADFCYNAVILDPEHYGGVSMFIPNSYYETYSARNWNLDAHQTSWYNACGWADTGW